MEEGGGPLDPPGGRRPVAHYRRGPVPRRRHYAWTVLGLCFLAILCAQGVRLSFGAFVRPWEEAFGASRGTITLIGSLSFLVYGGSQPFVGWGGDRLRVPPPPPPGPGVGAPRMAP